MTPRLFKTASALRYFLADKRGQAFDIVVLHNDGCTPSRCVCRPWYEVRDLTVENHLDGLRQEAAWLKAVCS
jgi:hypothetical protein